MSWKDNLRPASFRGVSFFIGSSQKSLGRRSVLHEFPNRETPYTDDMGRIAEGFSIDGHVLGDDYFEAKRKLETAFNKKGPGELIHPYYGSKIVQVGPVSFNETTNDGAVLSFTAQFFEAGDNRFPKGVNDKSALLGSSVDTALIDIKSDFDNTFSIVDAPGFAVDSIRDAVSFAQDAFNNATEIFADIADAAAEVAFSINNLVAEINDLLQAPSDLSQRLLDSFQLLEDAISSSSEKTKSYKTFYDFGDDQDDVIGDTPIRKKEKENLDAFNNFMKRVSSIKSASTAQEADYASFQEAEETRENITDVIELQVRETIGTDLYQSLIDVNANLVDSLPDTDAELPNIKMIEIDSTTSSLNLTYDLFQDIKKEQDIIDRNDINHPGFIPAGSRLEVLDG